MRTEHDFLGEMNVPDNVYYGVQTMRAMENFHITGEHLDPDFIQAMAIVKKAAALANMETGRLDKKIGNALVQAASEIIDGQWLDQFPVDPIQGGAGTSVNMNMNEVLCNRALEIIGKEKGRYDIISPNNHANMAQSTNDVFPTSIKVCLSMKGKKLTEVLKELETELDVKADEFKDVIKMGRTHLQDAVPITLGQQLNAFASGMERSLSRLEYEKSHWNYSCLGGTAVGTGMGCLPGFRGKVNKHLSDVLGYEVKAYDDLVDGMMAIDDLIACHGQVVALSAQVWKLARDLRVMASGPNSGLREVYFEVKNPENALNPQRFASCSLESVITACNQVSANNSSILFGLKNGWLDLGACSSIPLRAMINSATMLKEAMRILTEEVLPSMRVNSQLCQDMAESSVSNTTMISTIFGYEVGSQVAHLALEENISPREAAKKLKILPDEVIEELFDVSNLTHPENMEALFEKYKDFRKL